MKRDLTNDELPEFHAAIEIAVERGLPVLIHFGPDGYLGAIAFVAIQTFIRNYAHAVIICSESGAIRDMLHATRFDRTWNVYKTREEAEAKLAAA